MGIGENPFNADRNSSIIGQRNSPPERLVNNDDCTPATATNAAEHTALATLDKRIVKLASHLNAATCRWLRLVNGVKS